MLSDKMFNLISVLCFGKVLAIDSKTGKKDVWDFKPGIDFFISLFIIDMPTGEDVDYSSIFNPIYHFGYFHNRRNYFS